MSDKAHGLVALVRDAIDAGSQRVEAIQLATLARPVAILRALDLPVELVSSVVTLSVQGTHRVIRTVNRQVASIVDALLDARG